MSWLDTTFKRTYKHAKGTDTIGGSVSGDVPGAGHSLEVQNDHADKVRNQARSRSSRRTGRVGQNPSPGFVPIFLILKLRLTYLLALRSNPVRLELVRPAALSENELKALHKMDFQRNELVLPGRNS